MKPDIAVVSGMPPFTAEALEASFTVHKVYEAADKPAFLARIADRVRGIATSGGGGAKAALMDALPNTEIIGCFGVGYDAIDIDAAKARGIRVTNTPDVLTDDVADLALILLLDAARMVSASDRYVRAGLWPKASYRLTQAVAGKTAGIIGLGRIGKAIAKRLEACGMRIAYHGRSKQAGVEYPYYATARDLAEASDFLVLASPGGTETYHLVSAEVLAALGPKGTLINIARGSVVDEAAMIEALKNGSLGAAGLDVFENEPHVPEALFGMDNVVLLPHVGSATLETRQAMGQLMIDNLIAHFAGEPLLTPVA
ncbi:MAG TPA: 2-hydroxyacid dehydrogenase [Stellaceae bacterium]|nr:2-hydroxyacid dehydrogenase [Stellaceae bacterium]